MSITDNNTAAAHAPLKSNARTGQAQWLTSACVAGNEEEHTQALWGLCSRQRPDNITVSRVSDAHDGAPKQLAASCSKLNVAAREVVHSRLAEHGIVLNLALAQWGAVAGDKNQLRLAAPQGFQSRLHA